MADVGQKNEASTIKELKALQRRLNLLGPEPPEKSDIKVPRGIDDEGYRAGYLAALRAGRESNEPPIERAAAYEALLLVVKQAYDTPSWLGEAIDAVVARFG